jgi:hypothetical protein
MVGSPHQVQAATLPSLYVSSYPSYVEWDLNGAQKNRDVGFIHRFLGVRRR